MAFKFTHAKAFNTNSKKQAYKARQRCKVIFWDWYKSKIQEPEQSWIRFFSNRRRLDFGTGLRRWKWQNTAGQGLAVRALIMASRD